MVLKNLKTQINWSVYFSLIISGLTPTIYTTFRIFLLNDLPTDNGINIASQIQWLALIYEVLQEGLVLPLFFLLGSLQNNLIEFSSRVKSSLLVVLGIFSAFSVLISLNMDFIVQLLGNKNNITEIVNYIRLETIAFIFLTLTQIITYVLIIRKQTSYIYTLLVIQLLLTMSFDALFLSSLPFSMQLGVQGVAYSNILSYGIIFTTGVILINRDIPLLSSPMRFDWLKQWLKVGSWSGLDSFARNLAYTVMIIQIMNTLSHQGTYWQTTSFIWGWLLLPVLKLGEIIKADSSQGLSKEKYNAYITLTSIISALWILFIPLYKSFFIRVLNIQDPTDSIQLLYILIPFYIVFTYGQIWSSIFYGVGKTSYIFLNTAIVNIIYYGAFFVCYKSSIFIPTLNGVACMFGGGLVFSSLVLYIQFRYFVKRESYDIL